MMRLLPTIGQRSLGETAERFFRSHDGPMRLLYYRDGQQEVGFSTRLWQEMADLGWCGFLIEKEYGGALRGYGDMVEVLQPAGRVLAPEPFVSTLLLGADLLTQTSRRVLKKRVLPLVARGRCIVSVALQERGVSYPLQARHCTATEREGGYLLEGDKTAVLDGHVARHLIVSAALKGGTALFFLDAKTPGMCVRRHQRVDGLCGATLSLRRVWVPQAALLLSPEQTLEVLPRVLDRATVGVAAMMLGGAYEVFERTLAYLRQRRLEGVPIGAFQALQHRVARLYVRLSMARSALRAAVYAADWAPAQLSSLVSLAKVQCGGIFEAVAKEAIQLHGGIAMTDACEIGLFLKRARGLATLLGDDTYHRDRWAVLRGY